MLKFIYGVMGSSKSAQALMTKFNYESKGFKSLVLKPITGIKDGIIESRVGLKSECISLGPQDLIATIFKSFRENNPNSKYVIIVDEVQFCSNSHIDELKCISEKENIDVFCYGLKNNVLGHLFDTSSRLLEIADDFEDISGVCECGKKAIYNIMLRNGKRIINPYDMDLKDIEYKNVCYICFHKYKEEIN